MRRFGFLLPYFILFAGMLYLGYAMLPRYAFVARSYISSLSQKPLSLQIIQTQIEKYLPKTTPPQLVEKINQYRASIDLPVLKENIPACPTVTTPSAETSVNASVLCPRCTHSVMMSISKYGSPNEIVHQFVIDPNTSEVLSDKSFTSLCVRENADNLLVYIARLNLNAPNVAAPPRKVTAPATKPVNFSESDLWNALMLYRQSHQRSNFELDENLCTYARKRVQDHLRLYDSAQPEDYPNPDKYPLDAHSGFAADAESGYAFDVAKVNQLAENLAYWPSASSPVHVIEWGWDSSTEGHREAQLSNDWSKGCLSGQDGFYVAIFGR